MMFFRFLTALGASAPMSIGGAVITDIFPPEQRGSAMTVFALAPQLGPVLGPVMGGWVTQEIGSWRWIFYIKAIAIFVFCAPMIFIKESYTPRILAKRAIRLRKETGNASLSTIFERRKETVAQIFMRGAVRPLVLFGKEPIIQMICVYVSVIYGVIHLLVATFPAVMGTVYAEYPGWASMHFIGIGVGTITGGMAGGFLTEIHYRRLTKQNGGIARPEFKLFSLLYTTWLSPLGLAGYFFITYWGVHWIFADVFIVLFCFGISAAVVSLQSYIVDCYSLLAGSALTSTIVIRSFFGFGATVGAEDLLLRGGLFWSGVSLSTLTTVTCVPIVFIVYYYGASMRSKSKYATHKR
jgi:MFS family permease